MKQTRRSFLNTSFTALGCGLTPSLLFQSCLPEKSDPLIIDYIGSTENYEYYNDLFKKIKKVNLVPGTLESSMKSISNPVFLDGDLSHKATYAIFLVEQGKDVMCSYPIAANLSEYNSIKEYLLRHDRRLGIINPLIYFPSIRSLKGLCMLYNDSISNIRISCHPDEIFPGFIVDGYAGTAQMLERMISYISGQVPNSLSTDSNDNGQLRKLQFDYTSFTCDILFDEAQPGWTMDVEGPEFRAGLDHSGLLTINDEPEPRVEPSSSTWDKAVIQNLENFINAVRDRSEPDLSSIDGLASIILNSAVEESLETGNAVRL